MKMMHGAFFLACSNISRTRLAPTPTNISTKSEPEMVKNGTLASPATARAIRVMPVPGGPTSSTPRGILPPSRWNLPGSRRNSTISERSDFASSTPATSSKVTRPCASVKSLARLLPKPSALPLAAQENPHADQRDEGQPRHQQRHEPRHAVALRARGDRHALAVEALDQARIVRRVGRKGAAVGEGAVNIRPLDQHVAHLAAVD